MRPTTDLERTVAPFKVISDWDPAGESMHIAATVLFTRSWFCALASSGEITK